MVLASRALEKLCADLCCGGGADAQVSTWQNPATVSPLQGKEWLQFRAPVPWLTILCVVFTHCIFPGADCKIGSFVKQGPAPSLYIVQPRPVGVHQWVSDSGARQSFLPSRLVSWPDQVTADRGWMPECYRSQESLVVFVLSGFYAGGNDTDRQLLTGSAGLFSIPWQFRP